MFCFTKPFKALYSSLSSPSTAVTADFSVSPVKPTPLAPTLTELCLSYPWKGHLKCGISILSNPMLQNTWSPPGRPIRAPCWFSSSQAQKGTEGSSRAQSGSSGGIFLCIFLESLVSSGSLDEMAPELWPSFSLSQKGISAQILFNLQVKASEFTILADAFLLCKERHTGVRTLSSSSGGTAVTGS